LALLDSVVKEYPGQRLNIVLDNLNTHVTPVKQSENGRKPTDSQASTTLLLAHQAKGLYVTAGSSQGAVPCGNRDY
jgi:hypothetical protein